MSKHSRQSMRMLLVARRCLAVLMLLVALPRITVHSHATLAGSGIDATTLSNHIQLFHSTSANDIPFDAPHLHWQWNSVVFHDSLSDSRTRRCGTLRAHRLDNCLCLSACLSVFRQPVGFTRQRPNRRLPRKSAQSRSNQSRAFLRLELLNRLSLLSVVSV